MKLLLERRVAFVSGAVLCLMTGLANAQVPADSDPQSYDQKIHESFDFAFGKGQLSTPGNAATETGGFIPAGAFLKASYCEHCHAEAYGQWRQSLHSNSFRTPFYRTSVNILRDTKGIEFTRHCDSCHNPVADRVRRANQELSGRPQLRSRWSNVYHLPFHPTGATDFRQWQLCDGGAVGDGGRKRQRGSQVRCRMPRSWRIPTGTPRL